MRLRNLLFTLSSSVAVTACVALLAPSWTWHDTSTYSTVSSTPIQLENGNLLYVSQGYFAEQANFFELDPSGQPVRNVSTTRLKIYGEHTMAELNGFIYVITSDEQPVVAKLNLEDGSLVSLNTPVSTNENEELYISGLVVNGDRVWVTGYINNIDNQLRSQPVLWSFDSTDTATPATLENIRYLNLVSGEFPDGGFALMALHTDDYAASSGFAGEVIRVDSEQNIQWEYPLLSSDRFMAADSDGFYLIQALDTERDEVRFQEWQGTAEQRWTFNKKLNYPNPLLLAHEGDKIMIEDGSSLYGATVGMGQTWSHSFYENKVVFPDYYFTETSFNRHALALDDGQAVVTLERHSVRPVGIPIANYNTKVTSTLTEIYELYDIDGTLLKTFAEPAYARVVDAPGYGSFDFVSEQSPDSEGICYLSALTPLKENHFASSNIFCTGDYSGANPGVSVFAY